MQDSRVVHKAGGIITRRVADDTLEVYLVHRGRYDDWSLPKGHRDPGETSPAAALREVQEETGWECQIRRQLPPYQYTSPSGEPIVVDFYEMEPLAERGTADTEADRGEWMSLDEARSCLSYPALAEYLARCLS